jgi:hypothetical protein
VSVVFENPEWSSENSPMLHIGTDKIPSTTSVKSRSNSRWSGANRNGSLHIESRFFSCKSTKQYYVDIFTNLRRLVDRALTIHSMHRQRIQNPLMHIRSVHDRSDDRYSIWSPIVRL